MIVFWDESSEEAYQEAFVWSAEPNRDNQDVVKDLFDNLKNSGPSGWMIRQSIRISVFLYWH